MFSLGPEELKVFMDAVTKADNGTDGFLSKVAVKVAADLKPPNPSVKEPATSALQGDNSQAMHVDSTLASSKNQATSTTG